VKLCNWFQLLWDSRKFTVCAGILDAGA